VLPTAAGRAASGSALRQPGRDLQRDGRWLHYRGRPVYLLGVDQQQIACQTDVDYASKLDVIKAAGMNKIRIWGSNYFMDPWGALQPVAYRDGRFDLDSWDEAYWARMKDFVQKARARGIVVEYTLFANYADPEVWSGKYSGGMFWNKDRNCNGAFSANAAGSLVPEFYYIGAGGLPRYSERTTSGHDLWYYERRIADKAVSELGRYGNVYFELFNEWPGKQDLWQQAYPWSQEFADRVHRRGQIVTVHVASPTAPEALPYYWDRPSVDVLGFHTYVRTPREVFDIWRPALGRGKVLQCNESWSYLQVGPATVVREAWAHFLCGAYYGVYLDSPQQIGSNDGWQTVAAGIRALRRAADSVRFWEMSPVDGAGQDYSSLVRQGPGGKGWQVLCRPGMQYVIYFWGAPSTAEVRVRLPKGEYGCRWLDARDGRELGRSAAAGAEEVTIPSPPATWDRDFGLALVVDRR
jgi:hypothetical protein